MEKDNFIRDQFALIFDNVNGHLVLDTITEVTPFGDIGANRFKFIVRSGKYSGYSHEEFNSLYAEDPMYLEMGIPIVSEKEEDLLPSIYVVRNKYIDNLQVEYKLTRVQAIKKIVDSVYNLELVPNYEHEYNYSCLLDPTRLEENVENRFDEDTIADILSTDVVDTEECINDYMEQHKEENETKKVKSRDLKTISTPKLPVPSFNKENDVESEKEYGYPEIEEAVEVEEKIDIKGIVEKLSKKYIGQEDAIKSLLTNICLNKDLISSLELEDEFDEAELDARKIVILLDGTTGTGKTTIVNDIAKNLKLPSVKAAANSFSETGYIGPAITDTLKNLLRRANYDLEKAEKGIIIFDEFDKIAYTKDRNNSMKKGVQEELLPFISGGEYEINCGPHGKFLFNTNKLTFVFMGAFTDLRKRKIEEAEKRNIGFDPENKEKEKFYILEAEDYEKDGLSKETIGRIKLFTYTKTPSKEELKEIFLTSTISALWLFDKTVRLYGYEGVYPTDKFVDAVVDLAYEKGTGVRALHTIMASVQDLLLFDIMTGKDFGSKTIELDVDLLDRVKEKSKRYY